MSKCRHAEGQVYLFGQELDPCRYEEIEKHECVDLTVLRCKYCGAIELEWKRRPETVSHYLKGEKE